MHKDTSNKLGSVHLLKLLSVITACFLWFYVVNSEPITANKSYKVIGTPLKGLSIDKVSSTKVNIKLKGARAFLKEYSDNELTVNINLSKTKYKGKKSITYTLSNNDFHLPFGVHVEEIKPQVITFSLDKTIKKLVPIRAETEGIVASELNLVSLKVKPEKIMIEGPRSVMKRVGSVKTGAIHISTLSGQGNIPAFLGHTPDYISYVGDQNVTIEYDIRPKEANTTLKRVDIKFISSKQKFKPSKRRVSIDILVPDNRTLRKSEVKIYADIPDGKQKKIKVKLRAVLPEGVHLLKIHPSEITVWK
jgi:YbbR domain-containing protein